MNDLSDTPIAIFLVSLLTMGPTLSVLAPRTYQLTEGVTAIRLIGRCELWYYAPPAQEKATFALACLRTDLIRLWPLPVQQPWYEDEYQPTIGKIQAIR